MSTSPFAARITGTGSHFPSRIMTNDELSLQVETSDAWIQERTGIKERHISDTRNENEHNSSLALVASQRALEMAGKRAEDIDIIIYGTFTGDTILPSTGCWLQKKLGAKKAWAFDVNAACSGFVYSLGIADQFLRSGQHQTALVVGAEVITPYVNWQDRGSCILFGDGPDRARR